MDETILTVATSALQPGAKLAAAVIDGGGRILLPAGAVLGEADIGDLRQHGIEAVCVLQLDEDALPGAIAQRLDVLFRRAGDSEPALRLKRVVLEHRTEHRDGR